MHDPINPPAQIEQAAETAESLRAIALRQIAQVKELKEQRKQIREQKKNLLENDVLLADAVAAAEERNQEIKQIKAKVVATPEYQQNNVKDKELGDEIRELSDSITNHVVNYTKIAGDYLEDEEGNELKITHKVTVSSGQMRLF